MAEEDKKQEQQKEDKRIDRMVEVIDNASRHARMVYYLYLGFIAYCFVTVWGTTDSQLALKGDRVDLPILHISVPLDGFFILAPILAVGLFVYFMLYLHRLNSLIEGLGESYDKKQLYPWMINIAREPEKGIIGFLQRLFVGLTLWFTLPVTMFIFASKFVKKHEDLRSQIIVGLAFISILIVIWFWNQFNSSKKLGELREVFYSLLISLVIVAGWYGTIILIPQINEGKHEWANLNLRNEILVKIPEIGKDVEQGYWVDLEGANLNGADLTNTVLKRANLREAKLKNAILFKANLEKTDLVDAQLQKADLRGANLQEADLLYANLQEADLGSANLQGAVLSEAKLQGADLGFANLQEAKLCHANLQEARLSRANLQEANLSNANLQEAYLAGADFQGANLQIANLQEADLESANLQGAVLSEAKLQGADLFEAKLQEADLAGADFQGANLQIANLQGADLQIANLQGAYLGGANLQGADLGGANLLGAKELTREQLCGAGTLYEAKIDEDLLNQVKDEKEGCPYKLTEESYDEWVKKWREKQRQKEQEKAEEGNLSVQGKLIKMQEEIITIQKTLIEKSNESESSESQ